MPENADEFTPASVKREWNEAADAFAAMQAAGDDYYRYEFFGPQHIALCGKVTGLEILDLGCGPGYLSRRLAERGARVIGLDISEGLIDHARRREEAVPLGIEYIVADAVTIAERWPPETFDMVTSCVSLQDMPAPMEVIRSTYALLRPGGRFVSMLTHPCTDTPHREWELDEAGEKRALKIDRYFEEVALSWRWPTRASAPSFVTTGLHLTLGTWFDGFLDAGFRLRRLTEPRPTEEALEIRPDLQDAAKVPYFLGLDFEKPAS